MLTLGSGGPGECDPGAGAGCNPSSTAEKCKFSFNLSIVAKAPPLPDCCEAATYTYQARFGSLDDECEPVGVVAVGIPVNITIPFVQNIADQPSDCGKSTGFIITENCGGAITTLVDMDLWCCGCTP